MKLSVQLTYTVNSRKAQQYVLSQHTRNKKKRIAFVIVGKNSDDVDRLFDTVFVSETPLLCSVSTKLCAATVLNSFADYQPSVCCHMGIRSVRFLQHSWAYIRKYMLVFGQRTHWHCSWHNLRQECSFRAVCLFALYMYTNVYTRPVTTYGTMMMMMMLSVRRRCGGLCRSSAVYSSTYIYISWRV